MKLYDVLFYSGIKIEGSIKIDNTIVPFDTLRNIWDYLNQDVKPTIIESKKKEEIKMTSEVKERSPEKEDAINAIKEAFEKQKNKKLNLDDEEIVRLYEEENMNFTQIAKQMGCNVQTIINHYDRIKREKSECK